MTAPIPRTHAATAARWLPRARRRLAEARARIDDRGDLASVDAFDRERSALGRAVGGVR